VLPLGEFTVTIPQPHATLQGAVSWRNQCYDRATWQGVKIQSALLKIVFAIFYLFLVFNAVWALTSGGFRIVSIHLLSRPSRQRERLSASMLSYCSVAKMQKRDFLKNLAI